MSMPNASKGAIMETMAVHSPTWVGSNYFGTWGWYVPLGYSSDYFGAGAPDDGSAGSAHVHYYLKRAGPTNGLTPRKKRERIAKECRQKRYHSTIFTPRTPVVQLEEP
jgi:hypothetical protein